MTGKGHLQTPMIPRKRPLERLVLRLKRTSPFTAKQLFASGKFQKTTGKLER